jgi:hypothetical protein
METEMEKAMGRATDSGWVRPLVKRRAQQVIAEEDRTL